MDPKYSAQEPRYYADSHAVSIRTGNRTTPAFKPPETMTV